MPNLKKEIIEYIIKNKSHYEISKFDGDIFWYNQIAFEKVATRYKIIFFYAYFKNQPEHYWLALPIYSSYTDEVGEKLYKKYLDKPDLLLEEFYSLQNDAQQKFEKFIVQPLNQPEKLRKLYLDFVKSIRQYTGLAMFGPEALEKFLNRKLRGLIKDSKKREILTFPLYISYAQKQKEELLKIVESLPKQEILLLQKITNTGQYNQPNQLLSRYREEWGWSFLNYASRRLPSIRSILEMAISIAKTLKKEKEQFKVLEKKRKIKLIKLKKLTPSVKKTINLFDALLETRDQRKAFWLNLMIPFKKWLKRFALNHSFSYDQMRWLTYQEQCVLNKDNKKKFLRISSQRRNNCAICFGYKGEDFTIFTGEDALDIIEAVFKKEKLDTLKGISACAGTVRGRVNIVLSRSDFKKFEKNNILVASHTTPDYVYLMKKAKAILTERGGITSHAAIVSRELEIPCIVGIRGLIGTLKNGDLVEVDANKGVVRILGKK